jgi:hypothetical protein
MDEVWQKRIKWIGYLAIPAAAGATLILGMFILQALDSVSARFAGNLPGVLFPAALWLFFPELIWLSLVPFLHWSQRYRGRHSMLWLCLLVFETGGIFKLVYLFRHILPDWRGKGRYSRAPTSPLPSAEEAGAQS